MKGICALTGKETELRNSHIYPKFVINWMKETGSQYQRQFCNQEIRYQSGFVINLLSDEAEEKFSKRERWFANNVFRPYLDNPAIRIKYDENLFYFAISMLWRCVYLDLNYKGEKNEDFIHQEKLKDAEKEWRDFLNEGKYPYNFDNIYLLAGDRIKDDNFNCNGVEYYFNRLLDMTTIFNTNGKVCVYAKFSRFFFFGTIKGYEKGIVAGDKINPLKGEICMENRLSYIDDSIYNFFEHRMNLIDSFKKPSKKQEEIIKNEIIRDYDRMKDTELFDILDKDNKRNAKN